MATKMQKDLAAGLALMIVNKRRDECKTAFDNYILNPSAINYMATTDAMQALQEVRNTQRAIADWEIE